MQSSVKTSVQALIAAVILSGILFASMLSGCDDFLTDDVVLGGASSSSTSSSTSSSSGGSGSTFEDDDDDGLSNQTELAFNMDEQNSDTDADGIADGLEFVGNDGDPLNPRVSPDPINRSRILNASDVVRGDPDADLDGLGNAFETSKSLESSSADTDGDGHADGLELVADSDPFLSSDRPSRDAPPTTNGADLTGLIAPIDSDGDGLADEIESLNATLTNSRDSDVDGFSDGLEFLMGSDATDELSVPNFIVPPRTS